MSEEVETALAEAGTASSDFVRKAGTVAVLSGVAAVSLAAEASGVTHDMPSAVRAVVDSGAHPVLGYIGAWAATALRGNSFGRLRTKIALLGATVADVAIETTQSALIASPQYVDFLSSRNLPETTKDYVFALGGAAFFLWQSRREDS